MGRPWVLTPVGWHSGRIFNPAFYGPMTPEELAYIRGRFRNFYTADWDYSLTTVYFFCSAIALAAFFNLFVGVRTRINGGAVANFSSRSSPIDRFVALARWFSSRHLAIRHVPFVGTYFSPSVGSIVAAAGIWTFILGLTFGRRPYYWPSHNMGHSQPIATRTGWISIGIMPFMVAFATKVNWVGILTGTSHEKLQIFHRWSALIMYITSLIHTFPFIIKSVQAGKMESEFSSSVFYWTGVVALVPQTWLCAMSWGMIRNPYYETFKKFHFIAATLFMVALFLHCNWRLTSWDYFWATMGLYLTAWLFRVLRTHYNCLLGSAAQLSILPDQKLSIRIHVPPRVKWAAGQHVFLRFYGQGIWFYFFSSHPFTIASLHQEKEATKDLEADRESSRTLDVVSKVHDGITKALFKLAGRGRDVHVKVLVDGPYGGLPRGIVLEDFNSVLLLAGGTGSTFILPIFSKLFTSLTPKTICRKICFVIVVRDAESLSWIEPCLSHARTLPDSAKLSISVHVTRLTKSEKDHEATSEDGSLKVSSSSVSLHRLEGRPDIPSVIEQYVGSSSGRVAIAACGPDSFLYDSRNTVAKCQLAIANATTDVREIYLHTENYGW